MAFLDKLRISIFLRKSDFYDNYIHSASGTVRPHNVHREVRPPDAVKIPSPVRYVLPTLNCCS